MPRAPRRSPHAAPPSPGLGCTCRRLRMAARRVSQIYDQHLAPHGLTITQYGLLAQLRANDGIGIGALAERLLMDPSTLTRNLRPLERRGLLAQTADPRDGRARLLRLTAEGEAMFIAARPGWEAAQRHIETHVGLADAGALHASLEHLLDRLAGPPAKAT